MTPFRKRLLKDSFGDLGIFRARSLGHFDNPAPFRYPFLGVVSTTPTLSGREILALRLPRYVQKSAPEVVLSTSTESCSTVRCNLRSWFEVSVTSTTSLCSEILSRIRSGSTGAARATIRSAVCCYLPFGTSTDCSTISGKATVALVPVGLTSPRRRLAARSSTTRKDSAFFRPLGAMLRAMPDSTTTNRAFISAESRLLHGSTRRS